MQCEHVGSRSAAYTTRSRMCAHNSVRGNAGLGEEDVSKHGRLLLKTEGYGKVRND